MPNVAAILKSEISRVARKEVRAETEVLKSAAKGYRSELAALKRRTKALELELRRIGKLSRTGKPAANGSPPKMSRYSAKSLAAQRRRLGLSASDCGFLVGASPQSIYNWEQGGTRPTSKHLPAIAALKTLGKRQAAELVLSLRASRP